MRAFKYPDTALVKPVTFARLIKCPKLGLPRATAYCCVICVLHSSQESLIWTVVLHIFVPGFFFFFPSVHCERITHSFIKEDVNLVSSIMQQDTKSLVTLTRATSKEWRSSMDWVRRLSSRRGHNEPLSTEGNRGLAHKQEGEGWCLGLNHTTFKSTLDSCECELRWK